MAARLAGSSDHGPHSAAPAGRPAAAAPNPPSARASLPAGLQGKGNFYDLETLLFFAKHVDVKFAEYFKKASKEFGAGKQVTFVDRKVGLQED